MSDFSEEEQKALDAWTASEPPPNLAERVLMKMEPPSESEAQASRQPRKERKWLVPLSAAAAAAAVFALFDLPKIDPGSVTAGEHQAKGRSTLRLGDRAVIVSEAGTELQWSTNDGALRVSQPVGNAFYRVARRGPFVVTTPAGQVEVLGTCFRVEVKMNSKSSLGVAGVVGAALGALVTVTVYEGKVSASTDKGQLELSAGEGAQLQKGAQPKPMKPVLSDSANSANASVPREPEPAQPGVRGKVSGAVPATQEQVRVLQSERAALEREVAQLKQALEAAGEHASESKAYDFSEAELLRMAERCELRFDIPSLRSEPQTLPSDAMEKLQISEAEREVIDKKVAESHARLTLAIRTAYKEVTGDDSTGSMATFAMFDEVRDKTAHDEIKRIFSRLSRERAGLIEPVPGVSPTPTERMFRAVTSEGDRLQQSIAAELGDEVAKNLRALNKGWNSRFRSSNGCP